MTQDIDMNTISCYDFLYHIYVTVIYIYLSASYTYCNYIFIAKGITTDSMVVAGAPPRILDPDEREL